MSGSDVHFLSGVTAPGNAFGLSGSTIPGRAIGLLNMGGSARSASESGSTIASVLSSITSTLSSLTSTTTSSTTSTLTTSTLSTATSLLTSLNETVIGASSNTDASMNDSAEKVDKSFPMYMAIGSATLALTSIIVFLVLKRKYDREDEENTYICDETDVNDYENPSVGYAPQSLYCEPTTSVIEMTYNEYEESHASVSYDNVAEEGLQMYDFASEENTYSDGGYMFSEGAYDVAGGGSFYEEGCENSYELACQN